MHSWGPSSTCPLLTPHPQGLTGSQKGAGAELPPAPELTDVGLSLHGRSVPEELIKLAQEPLTAAFALILLLTVPSKRAKCSWQKRRWRMCQPGWLCTGTDPAPRMGHGPRELRLGGDPCAGSQSPRCPHAHSASCLGSAPAPRAGKLRHGVPGPIAAWTSRSSQPQRWVLMLKAKREVGDE